MPSKDSKKLGNTAEELCPEIPWAKIRVGDAAAARSSPCLGNVLRHEYDKVERFRVWYMVEDDLPPLKTATEAALRRIPK